MVVIKKKKNTVIIIVITIVIILEMDCYKLIHYKSNSLERNIEELLELLQTLFIMDITFSS